MRLNSECIRLNQRWEIESSGRRLSMLCSICQHFALERAPCPNQHSKPYLANSALNKYHITFYIICKRENWCYHYHMIPYAVYHKYCEEPSFIRNHWKT